MSEFAEYLHKKHWEYCESLRRTVTASEWVRELNAGLPEGNELSNGTVNQWMISGRSPDGKNVIRLIQVFGMEVLPYLGVEIEKDFAKVASRWKYKTKAQKSAILEIIEKEEPEMGYAQV